MSDCIGAYNRLFDWNVRRKISPVQPNDQARMIKSQMSGLKIMRKFLSKSVLNISRKDTCDTRKLASIQVIGSKRHPAKINDVPIRQSYRLIELSSSRVEDKQPNAGQNERRNRRYLQTLFHSRTVFGMDLFVSRFAPGVKTCSRFIQRELAAHSNSILSEQWIDPKALLGELSGLISELRRRDAGGGPEGAGEGAVVVKSAGVSDLGDGLVGFPQEPRGRGQAGL